MRVNVNLSAQLETHPALTRDTGLGTLLADSPTEG